MWYNDGASHQTKWAGTAKMRFQGRVKRLVFGQGLFQSARRSIWAGQQHAKAELQTKRVP